MLKLYTKFKISVKSCFSECSGSLGVAASWIILMLTLPGIPLRAQVSVYEFEQKTIVDVLNEIPNVNSGVSLAGEIHFDTSAFLMKSLLMNTGNGLEPAPVVSGPGYPIGFEFEYDGRKFDRFGLSTNGYIKLSHSKDGNFEMINDSVAGAVFNNSAGDTRKNNQIVVFQRNYGDFNYNISEVKYSTFGYPGNRSLSILFRCRTQFGQFKTIHYIITLKEYKNSIVLDYVDFRTENFIKPIFVGLIGGSSGPDNIKLREVTNSVNNWITSVEGEDSTSKCDYGMHLKPTLCKYIFSPPYDHGVPSVPIAFFKEDVKSNPNYIKINPSLTEGYFLADSATQVPLNAVLHWSGEYSESQLTYDVYMGLDSLNLELLAADISSTSFSLPPLAAGTRYYYKVMATNGAGASAEKVCWFETGESLNYCYPFDRHYNGDSYNTLKLNTFNYQYPGGNSDVRRFLDSSGTYTTQIKRDTSYLFSYTKGTNPACFGVWVMIDFNQNGSFDDPGEIFVSDGSLSATIQIPANAALGKTRMRIGRRDCPPGSYTSCSIAHQDFNITIMPSTACQGFTISPMIQLPLCHSDSTGIIDLQPVGGTLPYQVNWLRNNVSYPDSAMVLTDLTSGTYAATVTDSAGCLLHSGVLALAQPGPLRVDVDTAAGLPEVIATGGTPPYTYTWEGENTFEFTETGLLPPPGTYGLSVSDSAGCTYEYGTIAVPPPASIGAQVSGSGLMLYPNPGRGKMVLRVPQALGKVHFYISDMSGRRVYEGSAEYPGTTFAPPLPAGMYLLHALTGRGIETLKLIRE